ncbi:MAG: 50S ribosomal protein L16 [Deltaproteobacteria bacterium]|nr:50S ribosomal protein L16 [Deltaproteobacteria bacterium]
MLSPKKPRYRKQMKQVRHLRGTETRGCELAFGDYGLRTLDEGWITARQIEASRIAIARYVKRGGKVWIRIFPDKPLTIKPAETRMGSGKGSPEHWVAEVRAGRVLFEMTGVPPKVAQEALKRAAAKLPVRSKVVMRSDFLV